MNGLTERQKDILGFIIGFTFDHLYQPSMREIGEEFGIGSTNAVNDHLRALQRKGYLVSFDGLSRALGITAKALRWHFRHDGPCIAVIGNLNVVLGSKSCEG